MKNTQEKSKNPVVINGMQTIFDRYSEGTKLDWNDYFFLHQVLSHVHEKTLEETKKIEDTRLLRQLSLRVRRIVAPEHYLSNMPIERQVNCMTAT